MGANLELVREIYTLWEAGDYHATDWAHPDIELVFADLPDHGAWQGLAGMAEGWRRYLGTWDEFRTGVDEYRELDSERVLVLNHFSGRGKTSGFEVASGRARGASLFHVRDGKVAKLVLYANRARVRGPGADRLSAARGLIQGGRPHPRMPKHSWIEAAYSGICQECSGCGPSRGRPFRGWRRGRFCARNP